MTPRFGTPLSTRLKISVSSYWLRRTVLARERSATLPSPSFQVPGSVERAELGVLVLAFSMVRWRPFRLVVSSSEARPSSAPSLASRN
ncbi:hypothetical protein [Nocardioides sp.]|uniref:hypothetical protein n=1 Tax=Nocardioides sp. TaxID=35761 RepID=UPI003526D160